MTVVTWLAEGPTWLVFSTVLLGTSAESFTKKLSSTSISQHSCLHTGHRMAPTGTRGQMHILRSAHYYYYYDFIVSNKHRVGPFLAAMVSILIEEDLNMIHVQ